MTQELERHKALEVSRTAGRIMMEAHAESYRVEDTVRYILIANGYPESEVVAITSALLISADDGVNPPISLTTRIKHRGNHLSKIYRVNNISRLLYKKEIDLDQAQNLLNQVDDSEYNILSTDLAISLLIISFVVLLGGGIGEIVFATFASIFVIFADWLEDKIGLNDFVKGFLATAMVSIFTPLLIKHYGAVVNLDIIISSTLMPLFPGTAFTNGIRDTLKGDYLSGLSRITEALVIGLSLGLGVAVGLFISKGAIG